MNRATPRRFRHPLFDPDPALARQYRRLFDRPVPAPAPAQVDALARALSVGDPLADAWAAEARTLPRERATQLFERALTQGSRALDDAAVPSALRVLVAQLEEVPRWVDPRLLEAGGRAFRRTGLLGFFVLSDFGLMGGYRSSAIAKTLSMTGRLRDGTAARLISTGRFITQVTEPGALVRGAPGYVAAGHIRMVHAQVRAALQRDPDWSLEQWGLPINHADRLGTNLLFSIGLVAGAHTLALRFTDEDVHARLHLSRYVGHVLAVGDALMRRDEGGAVRAL